MNNRIGEIYISNTGLTMKIVEYYGWKNCLVVFDDGTIIKNLQYSHVKRGAVINPNHKSVFSIGYIGQGKYQSKINGKISIRYNTWKAMLERCYDHKYQQKNPSYNGCTVFKDWHNFQNFAKWFDEKYIDGFRLDKDILIKGNKMYSPDTCCFVPVEINALFIKSDKSRGVYPIGVTKNGNKYRSRLSIGTLVSKNIGHYPSSGEAFNAYKVEKENFIQEMANKWKSTITNDVFNALTNYKVEITD